MEVKVETDSNDAMEIKREADSNDISNDETPSRGIRVYIPHFTRARAGTHFLTQPQRHLIHKNPSPI